MEGGVDPRLSVVITTHNRVELVRRALDSVLSASPRPFEVVVVDDGSTPEAAAALDAIDDPAVRVVHQPDRGLSAAREHGVSVSRGEWITFLDDDDWWLPEWMDTFEPHLGSPGVGIVSGGARFVATDGSVLGEELPYRLGPLFGGVTAQYLAGCFVVRRSVYERSGGYLEGLSGSHQTELFIRMAATCAELGLEVRDEQRVVAGIERRTAQQRTLSNPELLFDATRWILARHRQGFALDLQERSNWEAIAALNAVRLHRTEDARRHAWRSLVSRPTDPRAWGRAAMVATPLGRRRWAAADTFATPSASQRNPLAGAVEFRGAAADDPGAWTDHLFLPWRYRQNPEPQPEALRATTGSTGRAARRRVIRVARRSGARGITLVAPAGGSSLRACRVTPVGTSLPSWAERVWEPLSDETGAVGSPHQLIVGFELLERVEDPFVTLGLLRAAVAPGGRVVLAVRDRHGDDRSAEIGPPEDRSVRREWSIEELRLVVEAAGFDLERCRRVAGGAVTVLRVSTTPAGSGSNGHEAVAPGRSVPVALHGSAVVRGRS